MPKQLSPLLALTRLGLSEGEISIYTALLEHGQLDVAAIIEKSGLKKGDCYNKLYSLSELGLIEELKKVKIQQYRLADPRTLEEVASRQYIAASQAKSELEGILPGILSMYTLTYHKPGIVLFEGEEAMRRILTDTLESDSEVLQFVDVEAFTDQYPKVNDEYVRNRIKLKRHKRVIVPESTASHEYGQMQAGSLFSIRYISHEFAFRNVSMYLYGNKISYLTLAQERMLGIIIEDPLLCRMHRQLFEFSWSQASI